ncbi:MAG: hypothetical protein J6X94_02240 [Lachnospiraceae bacterium]|nr:hypothetical protein [Lachnospiraceae bacterium]
MISTTLLICGGILFAVAWIALCLSKYHKWDKRKKNCSLEISAEVIDVLERKPMRGSSMLYKPVFRPMDAPEGTVIDSAYYSNLVSFKVGDKVDLLVNPENIRDFLYKDSSLNKGKTADIICCIIPAVILVIWFLLSLL